MIPLALSLLAVAAAGAPKAEVADSVATFSQLGPSEVLEVRYSSSGWLNGATFKLVFRAVPRSVTLSRLTRIDRDSRERLPTREITAALGDSAVAGLDSLLRYYRTRPRMGCKTTDHVDFSQVRGGVVVGREGFIDRSCGVDATPGILTLGTLIQGMSWADAARRESR